jgi:glycerol kinase
VEKTVSLFLSVDQSTSATKAILFDSSGQLLDQVALEHRQLYPQPGWVEHDAEEIYQNLLAVAGLLLKRRPEAQSAVGLSITNQRETFVLFDAATGQPLHNAVVWQCVRGEPLCRTLREAGHEPALHAVTGLKIDSYFPAAKVRALLDQRPDLAERLANGTALFGTIDTYLVYRLTGGAVYASDHTNASRTLLYDIQRCAWSTAMCRLFGLDFARLPELRESSAHFGVTDLGGQLVQPLPICGIMGDSQAALFAQRCFAPGEAKVTFGTGSRAPRQRHRHRTGVGARRAPSLRLRGHHQLHRGHDCLAARPTGADPERGRVRSVGAFGAGQRRRLSGACLCGAQRSLLATRCAGHHHRADARQPRRTRRTGGARVDRHDCGRRAGADGV